MTNTISYSTSSVFTTITISVGVNTIHTISRTTSSKNSGYTVITIIIAKIITVSGVNTKTSVFSDNYTKISVYSVLHTNITTISANSDYTIVFSDHH